MTTEPPILRLWQFWIDDKPVRLWLPPRMSAEAWGDFMRRMNHLRQALAVPDEEEAP